MKRFVSILAFLTALLFCLSAVADSLVLDGTVVSDETVQVYAPIGGTVDKVLATAGDSVQADTPLAELRTTKVYATEDGTVTGVFGQPGDSAETISARYGAVMYIEGESTFTVSASTTNAYNSTETKFVHVGETVYLQGRTSSSRNGVGVITGVDGINYTIEVSTGNFIVGDSVDVFRDSEYSTKQRIGRGTVSRRNPLAVSGSGSIISFAVASGDAVKRGDLLFETLDGTFDGYYMSGKEIYAGVNGTLAEYKISAGSGVQKGAVCAVIYPTSSMRVTAEISEEDLDSLSVGDPVTIELTADEDAGTKYEGTVSMISRIATSGGASESVTFTVYVDFEADSHVRYGMSALVSTPDNDADEDVLSSTDETDETEVKDETQVQDNPENRTRPDRERPDGNATDGGRGGIPEGGELNDSSENGGTTND